MRQKLLIFGVNHQSASVALRERLAYAENEIVPALSRLKQQAPSLAEAASRYGSVGYRVEIFQTH